MSSTTYRFTYPDGGNDAESILAEPDSARVWVVTKSLAGGTLYRVPLSTTSVTTAVPVAAAGAFLSDAAMSPDGRQFVIRGYVRARLYDTPVRASTFERPTLVTLPSQQQGEAITFTRDGEALLVASEGERAVWQVPLPVPASPTPSASPSGSTSGTPSGSTAAPGTSSSVGWRLGLAGIAVATAVAVGALAARRLRA